MNRSLSLSLSLSHTASVLVMFSGRAAAQIILPPVIVSAQRQVSGDNDLWQEVAAGGAYTDNQRIVLAAFGQRPFVTTDGGLSFTIGPDFGQGAPGDPFVISASPAATAVVAGRIYVGGLIQATDQVAFTYHDPDTINWTLNSITIANSGTPGFADKPWMAVGPDFANPGLAHYFVINLRSGCGPIGTDAISRSYSSNATSWTNGFVSPSNPNIAMCGVGATCHFNGWGMLPVILDNGDMIGVVRDTNLSSHGPGCYNAGMPYVIWSTDGGATWGPVNPDQTAGLRLGATMTAMLKTKYGPSELADTPRAPGNRNYAPTIAVDRRTTPNIVYVAFAARNTIQSELPDDKNADIWIFRGSRQDPSPDFVFGDVLHLTDELLNTNPTNPPGDPDTNPDGGGPDQWLPAIAIDCGGGINLTFFDNRVETQAPTVPDDDESLGLGRMGDVYYAHISNWPAGAPMVYTKRLTPVSVPLENIGQTDYMTLATAGPNGQRVYPVYIAPKLLPNASWTNGVCFIHQIVVRNCAVDLNLNGLADGADIDWFFEDYSESLPEADLTTDGLVNSEDVDEFVASFEEMGQP